METFNSKNWTTENWHPADEELLMLMDGELPAKDLAPGRAHLDACWACRARSEELQSTILSFVKYNDSVLNPLIDREPRGWGGFKARLNSAVLELGEPQPWYRNLLALKNRFSLFNVITSLRSSLGGSALRAAGVPAFLFLVIAGLITWFAVSPPSNISASEILSESERRTSIWETQPGKVLHWGYEATGFNYPGLPDGKDYSFHWQDNTSERFIRLNRHYDENGVLTWASWMRADGSTIIYKHFPEEEITVTPTTDALRAYAAGLDEKSRQVLENYIGKSKNIPTQTDPEESWRIKQQILYKPLARGDVQIIQNADEGKVFRIRSVRFEGQDKSIRVESEADFAADTFMRNRISTFRYYPDGTTGSSTAELKFYRETSIEDFNAHDLSTEMKQVKRIVQVTPEEVLKTVKRFEELRKNQQAK